MTGSIRIVFNGIKCTLLEVDGVNMLKGCAGVEVTMLPCEVPAVTLKYLSNNISIECSEANIQEGV